MKANWLLFVPVLLGLFGCAPIQVTCKVPEPPVPLMEPPPPSFLDRLDAILDGNSTTSPAKPTK